VQCSHPGCDIDHDAVAAEVAETSAEAELVQAHASETYADAELVRAEHATEADAQVVEAQAEAISDVADATVVAAAIEAVEEVAHHAIDAVADAATEPEPAELEEPDEEPEEPEVEEVLEEPEALEPSQPDDTAPEGEHVEPITMLAGGSGEQHAGTRTTSRRVSSWQKRRMHRR